MAGGQTTLSLSKFPHCGKQERMDEARQLFRNKDTTEFVIVTIPTVMAAAESGRLAVALRAEGVPVNTIVINQVPHMEAETVAF